jgi:hypothetical protein
MINFHSYFTMIINFFVFEIVKIYLAGLIFYPEEQLIIFIRYSYLFFVELLILIRHLHINLKSPNFSYLKSIQFQNTNIVIISQQSIVFNIYKSQYYYLI